MPYGYDKTRTERRCKDCNKLLYVFETGELCIECSRKQAKTWSVSLQTRWIEKNYDRTRSTAKKTIPNASWSRKRISCLHVRKIPKPATVWRFSCGLWPWTKNFHSCRRRIHCVLRMQAQQGWNRKVWWNSQLTVADYFFFSQSHSGRSSSSSIIIGFKQILIFLSYNKFHYSRYTIKLLIFFNHLWVDSQYHASLLQEAVNIWCRWTNTYHCIHPFFSYLTSEIIDLIFFWFLPTFDQLLCPRGYLET